MKKYNFKLPKLILIIIVILMILPCVSCDNKKSISAKIAEVVRAYLCSVNMNTPYNGANCCCWENCKCRSWGNCDGCNIPDPPPPNNSGNYETIFIHNSTDYLTWNYEGYFKYHEYTGLYSAKGCALMHLRARYGIPDSDVVCYPELHYLQEIASRYKKVINSNYYYNQIICIMVEFPIYMIRIPGAHYTVWQTYVGDGVDMGRLEHPQYQDFQAGLIFEALSKSINRYRKVKNSGILNLYYNTTGVMLEFENTSSKVIEHYYAYGITRSRQTPYLFDKNCIIYATNPSKQQEDPDAYFTLNYNQLMIKVKYSNGAKSFCDKDFNFTQINYSFPNDVYSLF